MRGAFSLRDMRRFIHTITTRGGGHLLLNVSRAIRNLLGFELHDRDNIDLLVILEDCGQVCCGFIGTRRCLPAYHRRLAEEENGLRNVSGS